MAPRTAWQAIAQRPLGFVATTWPLRALAYLVSGLVLGAVTAGAIAVMVTAGLLLLVVLVGAAMLLAIALCGIVVARFERWRLRLIDLDPAPNAHVCPIQPGVTGWLRTRLREPITWRELGFTALSLLALWWVDLLVLLFAIGAPVILIRSAVLDPRVWPLAVIGVALIPTAPFTITVWAAARGALARTILTPRDSELGGELTEVKQSRARLVAAFDDERTRIERDLHDGAQQRLASLRLTLGLLRLDAPPGSSLDAELDGAQQQVAAALADLRDVVRGVRSPRLSDHGLSEALSDVTSRFVLPVDVDVEVPRLPQGVELAAYYVVTEALANVAKHSHAHRVSVHARHHTDLLTLQVRDDGAGGADAARGSGLTGLADRLAVVEGRLRISSPRGGPTLMHVEIPCRPL